MKINELKLNLPGSSRNSLDLRDVNEIADQISKMSHMYEVFDAFLKKKVNLTFSFKNNNITSTNCLAFFCTTLGITKCCERSDCLL